MRILLHEALLLGFRNLHNVGHRQRHLVGHTSPLTILQLAHGVSQVTT